MRSDGARRIIVATVRQQTFAFAGGALYALAAYGMWGLTPVYWRALESIPSPELLAHRVLWSFGVAALALSLTARWRALGRLLADTRRLAPVIVSALLIAGNWLTFLYAIETDRVLETSLGYYVNPLMSVALGALVLRERLRPAQWLAVAIAAAGVLQLVAARGALPWIALVLATSFALYGLVRKTASAPPLLGFGVETLLLSPAAAGYLLWLGAREGNALPLDPPEWTAIHAWVVGSGLVTAAPLLCFASAARRLPLATLGMFQYIAPTLTFALAVGRFGETFTSSHAVAFACVWLALALYSADSLRATRALLDAKRPVRENRGSGGPR